MLVCFTLKNREGVFMVSGLCEVETNDYPQETLEETFNDKIVEYDWVEDQSVWNAINVVKDTIYELNCSEKVGLVYQTDFGFDKIAEEYVKSNEFRESNSAEFGMITLMPDVAESWLDSVDFYVEKAAEEPDPAF